jgi:hypothetical protein
MIKKFMVSYRFLYVGAFEPPAPSILLEHTFTTDLKDAFWKWKPVLQAKASYTSQDPM